MSFLKAMNSLFYLRWFKETAITENTESLYEKIITSKMGILTIYNYVGFLYLA